MCNHSNAASASIQLYDRKTILHFDWPNTENGRYVKNYLMPLMTQTTDTFIANVRTELYLLVVGEHLLPVTVNDTEYDNCYVCSPYTHYVSYASQELSLLPSRAIRAVLSGLLRGVGLLLRASRINRTVHINNWMLSTNLYPSLSESETTAILHTLQQRFPKHTIVFRSLNSTCTPLLLNSLREIGARMVPSRQVYLHHPSHADRTNSKMKWLIKRDYTLIHKHGYEIVQPDEFTEEDLPAILELYNGLYLHKYSMYNPQFQFPFLRLALQHRILNLYGLRKNGKLDAVLGFFCRDGVMTTPLFGYDLSKPKQTGLYRMISALLLEIATENGHLLHESSGAAQFKRNRGAVAEIEFNAVYDRHLPLYRRIGWKLLEWLIGGIGVPLMRKLKL